MIDADTIEIHGQRIRIWGIDAPEGRQTCQNARGKDYRCGQLSANALAQRVNQSQPISCMQRHIDRYRRVVAQCSMANGEDIAAWLVRNGHALDWPQYSKGLYAKQQDEAKRHKTGIWQGKFMDPWKWRRGKSRNTEN